MPRKLSQDFTKTRILGLPIGGKPEDSKPLIFPRHVADAVHSITRHRLDSKQNRIFLQFIRRGFSAQHGDLNSTLLEGLENITSECVGNTILELRQRIQSFPIDRPLSQDEAATVSALAAASASAAFLARNRKRNKPSRSQNPDPSNHPAPSIPLDERF
jgi:hypothetical protein